VQTLADAAAAAAPFVHVPGGDPAIDRATFIYERWLRYLRLGLAWAGSRFAFHSIGSTLSVRAEPYAHVRGFPRRSAGEDFHLLAKLAKVGTVARLAGEPVRIRARRSNRVPFGTGPGVERVLAGDELVPDPSGFVALRSWLAALDTWSLDALEPELADAVERLGIRPRLDAIARDFPAEQRPRRVAECFDALQTVRLLNRWGESHPRVPFAEAARRSPFLPDGLADDPLEAQLSRLHALDIA
jgi:hypothetical protein